MNIEKHIFSQNVSFETPEEVKIEDSPEKSESVYGKAMERLQELKESLPEAERYFRERPVRSPEEAAMSAREKFVGALMTEKETSSQQNNEKAERFWERIRQYEEARNTVLGIYFDCMADKENGGEVVAQEILEENPWITEVVDEGKDAWLELEEAA